MGMTLLCYFFIGNIQQKGLCFVSINPEFIACMHIATYVWSPYTLLNVHLQQYSNIILGSIHVIPFFMFLQTHAQLSLR